MQSLNYGCGLNRILEPVQLPAFRLRNGKHFRHKRIERGTDTLTSECMETNRPMIGGSIHLPEPMRVGP